MVDTNVSLLKVYKPYQEVLVTQKYIPAKHNYSGHKLQKICIINLLQTFQVFKYLLYPHFTPEINIIFIIQLSNSNRPNLTLEI